MSYKLSQNPDIILYFEEVRKEHVHKYLLLNKELNKYSISLLMIRKGKGGGPYGIEEEYYNKHFSEEYKKNVLLVDDNIAAQIIHNNTSKIAVFGSGKFVNASIINHCKSKGALTFQVSKVFGDLYNKGADISCYINELHLQCDTAQGFKINPNRLFTNNFLFDRTGDGLSNQMSKEDFCKKYNLNPDKEIFVYLPTAIQCVHGDENAQKAYRHVCKNVDNLIIKLHPNEYARWKADRVGYKWSYEIYTDKKIPVLEQQDAHWCYEYVDCGIAYQSGIGIEFGIYETPIIYLRVDNPLDQGVNGPWWKEGYSWVGPSCKIEDLDGIIENKKYETEDELAYLNHKAKYLFEPNEHGYKVLSRNLLSYLK